MAAIPALRLRVSQPPVHEGSWYRAIVKRLQMLTATPSSAYETHFRQADQVGSDVAAFAIGSLSTLATTNPQIQVPGLVPYLGSKLAVHWDYILPLLVGIATVHAALSGFGVYLKAKFEEKTL